MQKDAVFKRLASGELPAALLVACGAILPFVPHLLAGTLQFEDDLPNYFWPVMRRVSESLRTGRLPLWTPDLFGGFPLFADSEAGTLFPVNWLMVFVAGPAGLRLVLMLAIAAAALSMYAFARHLGLARSPSAIAAWAFALGGFFTGHLIHVSVLNAAWPLPLVLLSLDRALAARGPEAHRWLVAAGFAHGLQWLGGHVQPPIMTWMLAAGWLVFRLWISPWRGQPTGHARRVVVLLTSLAAMTVLALGVASAQLVPTLELALQGTRAGGVDYAYAASYAVSPFDLVSLVMPYFFQHDSGVRWGLWATWETAAYVGVLPLMLALFAVGTNQRAQSGASQRRLVWFLAIVALISLWLALSPYLPLNIHRMLFNFPGLNVLRAPARFVMLFDFAAAMLAAIGAQRLMSTPQPFSVPEGRRIGAGVLAGAATVIIAVFVTAGWIGANRQATITWLDTVYAGAPQAGLLLPPQRLFDFLQWAVWLGNPRVASALLLLGASAVWMAAASTGLLSVRGRQRIGLALVLVDLCIYAALFWQAAPLDAVDQPNALARQVREAAGSDRVLVASDSMGSANWLFGWGVAAIDGYSSLALRRQAQIVAQARWHSNTTLDVLGVGTVLVRATPRLLEPPLNPRAPIAIVDAGTAIRDATFNIREPAASDRLHIVSALEHAPLVEQGAEVGIVTVTGTHGETQSWPIRAGIETAEWALNRADVRAVAQHRSAPVALRFDATDTFGRSTRQLYQADLELAQPMSVASVSLRVLDPRIRWQVFRINVGERASVQRWDLAHFELIGADPAARLYRNTHVLARARRVPEASVELDAGHALDRLASPAFNAWHTVILEEAPREVPSVTGAERYTACGEEAATCGSVAWQSADDEHLQLRVNSPADAWLVLADTWYPGWRATIDGATVPLYRANYVQRAVFVAAGNHRIDFVFDPVSVKLGFGLSALSMIAALGACAARPAAARGGA